MAVRRVFVNAVNLPTTTHAYSPTTTGAAGHDESFSTYHGNAGGGSKTVIAQHDFTTARNIQQLKYRLFSYGYAYGDNQADVTVEYQLQYTTNGSTWINITTSTA